MNRIIRLSQRVLVIGLISMLCGCTSQNDIKNNEALFQQDMELNMEKKEIALECIEKVLEAAMSSKNETVLLELLVNDIESHKREECEQIFGISRSTECPGAYEQLLDYTDYIVEQLKDEEIVGLGVYDWNWDGQLELWVRKKDASQADYSVAIYENVEGSIKEILWDGEVDELDWEGRVWYESDTGLIYYETWVKEEVVKEDEVEEIVQYGYCFLEQHKWHYVCVAKAHYFYDMNGENTETYAREVLYCDAQDCEISETTFMELQKNFGHNKQELYAYQTIIGYPSTGGSDLRQDICMRLIESYQGGRDYYWRIYDGFNELLGPKEQESMVCYLPVLKGEEKVYFGNAFVNMEYLEQQGKQIIRYPWMQMMTLDKWKNVHLSERDCYDWIDDISFIDIDDDGKQEMVLTVGNYLYRIVFHQEDDITYAIVFGIRGFNDIFENGIHVGSGGAGYNSHYKLGFKNGMFVDEKLAQMEWPEHYIGGKPVSEEKYQGWIEDLQQTYPRNIEYNISEMYEEEERASFYAQLEIYAENSQVWMRSHQAEDISDETYYAVYDFGQDGYVELVSTAKLGNGQYSENHVYQVRNGEVVELNQRFYGKEGDEFDLLSGTLFLSFDEGADVINYATQNTNLDGASWQQTCNGYFYMEEDVVIHVPVLGYECERSASGEQIRYYQMVPREKGTDGEIIFQEEDISREDYNILVKQYKEEKEQQEIELSFYKMNAGQITEEEIFLTMLLSYQESVY